MISASPGSTSPRSEPARTPASAAGSGTGTSSHTEYAPLLKHSGIGLITSYIVWTDRREHSPYRGYAFPSLQSQAAFSGSDRAELITINRILVALDLIEIRKEMVLRIDEKGHKWRVPHNLYRVKDRSGDPHLTTADVTRVLELAEERKDVYRHIRHLLTSSFVPISRNNVWHQILAESAADRPLAAVGRTGLGRGGAVLGPEQGRSPIAQVDRGRRRGIQRALDSEAIARGRRRGPRRRFLRARQRRCGSASNCR